MSDVTLPFVSILTLFVFLLIVKKITKWKYCTICVSVSLTWILLLVMSFAGLYSNMIVIALLMGQSAVGMYYLLEKRVKEELLLFRLPFLLSETWAILFILGAVSFYDISIFLVTLSWVVILLMYAYRNNKKINIIVKNIIACCKDW